MRGVVLGLDLIEQHLAEILPIVTGSFSNIWCEGRCDGVSTVVGGAGDEQAVPVSDDDAVELIFLAYMF